MVDKSALVLLQSLTMQASLWAAWVLVSPEEGDPRQGIPGRNYTFYDQPPKLHTIMLLTKALSPAHVQEKGNSSPLERISEDLWLLLLLLLLQVTSVVSDSVRPHRWKPTRLLRPWDFPDKSTGVGCHCHLRGFVDIHVNNHRIDESFLGPFFYPVSSTVIRDSHVIIWLLPP